MKILKQTLTNYSNYVNPSDSRCNLISNNYRSYWSTFFLNWARKPSLVVTPRPNNPSEGEKPVLPNKESELSSGEGSTSYFLASWTEKGQNEVSKLTLKFVAVDVFNQPKNWLRGIYHAGRATNLRADIFIVQTAIWQSNSMVEIPKKDQTTYGGSLDWYYNKWFAKHNPLSSNPKDDDKKRIEEYKLFKTNQTSLVLKYLDNKMLDEIAVGRGASLILFVTMPDTNGFLSLPKFEWESFGSFLLRIRVTCNETSTENLIYRLDIRGWNDYNFTWIGFAQ